MLPDAQYCPIVAAVSRSMELPRMSFKRRGLLGSLAAVCSLLALGAILGGGCGGTSDVSGAFDKDAASGEEGGYAQSADGSSGENDGAAPSDSTSGEDGGGEVSDAASDGATTVDSASGEDGAVERTTRPSPKTARRRTAATRMTVAARLTRAPGPAVTAALPRTGGRAKGPTPRLTRRLGPMRGAAQRPARTAVAICSATARTANPTPRAATEVRLA